jgi:hypothetical protein
VGPVASDGVLSWLQPRQEIASVAFEGAVGRFSIPIAAFDHALLDLDEGLQGGS